MRNPAGIRHEIATLSERRTELWQEIANDSCKANDPGARSELAVLGQRIEALWVELRAVSVRLRQGSPQAILERARRAERAEKELRRWVHR